MEVTRARLAREEFRIAGLGKAMLYHMSMPCYDCTSATLSESGMITLAASFCSWFRW